MYNEILMENPEELKVCYDPCVIVERKEFLEIVSNVLHGNRVNDRKRAMFNAWLKYGNFSEVGRHFNVSPARIREIVYAVGRIIRHYLYMNGFYQYDSHKLFNI